MKTVQPIGSLLHHGIRYRLLKYRGRPYRLQSISLEITHRCICRCSMCNIWKIPADTPDLDLFDWLQLLASPELRHLRELDLTGGEPFLRQDLRELLLGICALQSAHMPELRTVSITTNGLLTSTVLARTEEIVPRLQERRIDLVLACGMDGVGEIHDRIRNFPGAWKRLDETLAGLRQIARRHPNLVLGIKTTVVPANVRELTRIADYAEQNGLFTIISPRIITANRFDNSDREAELRFSGEEVEMLLRFYRSLGFAWSGHREGLVKYLTTGTMLKPCSAGINTLFIRYNGEVHPCPVRRSCLGTLRRQPLGQLFRSPAASRFRRHVGSFPECRGCTEPGMERLAWPLEGLTLLRFRARAGKHEFARLFRHMGLEKLL